MTLRTHRAFLRIRNRIARAAPVILGLAALNLAAAIILFLNR